MHILEKNKLRWYSKTISIALFFKFFFSFHASSLSLFLSFFDGQKRTYITFLIGKNVRISSLMHCFSSILMNLNPSGP